MPKGAKSPGMWYARAQQFRIISDALEIPMRLNGWESESEFAERLAVFELTRARLLRESNKCWANGGRLELERAKLTAAPTPEEG